MSSWLLEENTLQPHQAALLQEQGGARDAFPKLRNWQARGPRAAHRENSSRHEQLCSPLAQYHSSFFFHQVTFNLCPDISRESCLISPIRAGHLPTPLPEVIDFGSIAGWPPASHNLPCESSLSLGISPSLRLMIASKKLSNLPSWIFCPSSHTLPPFSWPGRLKTPRGCPLWAADEAMLPLSFSMFFCVLGGRGQAQSCLLLLVATYPWLCFFPIYHCCYH